MEAVQGSEEMNIQEAVKEICKRLPIGEGEIFNVLKNVATWGGVVRLRDIHQLLSFGVSFSDDTFIDIKIVSHGECMPTYQDLEKHLIALAEKWKTRA